MQITTYTPAERLHTCQACTLADAMKICQSCQFYTEEPAMTKTICQCTESHATTPSQCKETATVLYNNVPMCAWCARNQNMNIGMQEWIAKYPTVELQRAATAAAKQAATVTTVTR